MTDQIKLVRRLINEMLAACDDAAQLGGNPGNRFILEDGFLLVTTRRSRNPLLNSTGGDYTMWTEYGLSTPGQVSVVECWSCDIDGQQSQPQVYNLQ